jgi:RNA polymerase sigma factor (TIGR02999 family)
MTGTDITRKLQAWMNGDTSVLEDLLPFVITNMRAIAHRTPKRGCTMSTTALVNEAWLHLSGAKSSPSDREHFLALVARAMRHILIDHARAQQRLKRGGGAADITLTEDLEITDSQVEQLLIIMICCSGSKPKTPEDAASSRCDSSPA